MLFLIKLFKRRVAEAVEEANSPSAGYGANPAPIMECQCKDCQAVRAGIAKLERERRINDAVAAGLERAERASREDDIAAKAANDAAANANAAIGKAADNLNPAPPPSLFEASGALISCQCPDCVKVRAEHAAKLFSAADAEVKGTNGATQTFKVEFRDPGPLKATVETMADGSKRETFAITAISADDLAAKAKQISAAIASALNADPFMSVGDQRIHMDRRIAQEIQKSESRMQAEMRKELARERLLTSQDIQKMDVRMRDDLNVQLSAVAQELNELRKEIEANRALLDAKHALHNKKLDVEHDLTEKQFSIHAEKFRLVHSQLDTIAKALGGKFFDRKDGRRALKCLNISKITTDFYALERSLHSLGTEQIVNSLGQFRWAMNGDAALKLALEKVDDIFKEDPKPQPGPDAPRVKRKYTKRGTPKQ